MKDAYNMSFLSSEMDIFIGKSKFLPEAIKKFFKLGTCGLWLYS
jgi:hypothetical protein